MTSEPGTPQAHDAGTMPFGAHDAAGAEEGDTTMRDPREHAIARLQREAIGATPEQAAGLVDDVGVDTVNAESDAQLAARLQLLSEAGYDPTSHNIADVKEHVGDDVEVARLVLVAELESDAPRKTLVEWLETLTSAPGEDASLEGNPVSGDEPGAEGEADGGGTTTEGDSS